MSTKIISTQTLESSFGPVQVSDHRGKDDNSGERTVASVWLKGEFTVNNKYYNDVILYLDRAVATWQDGKPSLGEYNYRGKLTEKARDKVAKTLLEELPELSEYLEVLDAEEKHRLKMEDAERSIIRAAYTEVQGLSQEDALTIFCNITAKLEEQSLHEIYFGK